MSERAPPFRNEPPTLARDLTYAADSARELTAVYRRVRQRKAVARAERLWGASAEPFVLSGLAEPEPWGEAVSTGDMLDAVAALVARHVRLSDEAAVTIALWLAHAWSIEWAVSSPRLAIVSASSVAGKTTALRVVGSLSPRPLMLAEAMLRPLLRVIDSTHPTLLIDEADRWALGHRRLRMALVSGHARDGLYLATSEKKHEEQAWSCFTPCAVTLARAAPGDFARRCITVALAPVMANERPGAFLSHRPPPEFALMRRRLARWARDHGAASARDGEPVSALPPAALENWRPLLSIARHAGGAWTKRAEAACRALAASELERPLELELLADIRSALGTADRMTTVALLKSLLANDERPWRRLERGRPLDARSLARRLAPFAIRPRNFRVERDDFARGYVAADFAEACARYLEPALCAHT